MVVHTWLAVATPPPTRVSRQRPAAKVSLKLRLLYRSLATGRIEKCSEKGIAEILLNCAVSRTDQHIGGRNYCTELVQQRLPRLHYVDQTWTLVGTAGPKWDPAKFYETYTFNNLHFQTIVPFLQFYLTLKLKT